MLLARQIMSTNLATTTSEASLHAAYDQMRSCGIRHLPVVDEGQLVGMLSWEDVLLCAELTKHQLLIPDRPVGTAMTRNVISCFPTSMVEDIAATMVACKIDSMPVVADDGALVGIVTTTDLLDRLCREDERRTGRVKPLDVVPWGSTVPAV